MSDPTPLLRQIKQRLDELGGSDEPLPNPTDAEWSTSIIYALGRVLFEMTRRDSDWSEVARHATKFYFLVGMTDHYTTRSELINSLYERSERKLRLPKNLAKDSWVTMRDPDVRAALVNEAGEFLMALGAEDSEATLDEAADVLHFASMGADPARRTDGQRYAADRWAEVRALREETQMR
jgi:phosphoribosyl-ATP pyrophosphohydrolase